MIVVIVAYVVAAVLRGRYSDARVRLGCHAGAARVLQRREPRTYQGVAFRMAGEVLAFTSLFRADKLLYGAYPRSERRRQLDLLQTLEPAPPKSPPRGRRT